MAAEEGQKLVQHVIDVGIDDHLFIMIRRPDRPTISLDFYNPHGRANLSVRADGHGIASIMCDVDWKEPAGGCLGRYCPMCGEEINHLSSAGHQCKGDAI